MVKWLVIGLSYDLTSFGILRWWCVAADRMLHTEIWAMLYCSDILASPSEPLNFKCRRSMLNISIASDRVKSALFGVFRTNQVALAPSIAVSGPIRMLFVKLDITQLRA
jgi:hypothetical protein